jgi:hypothetical protein
MAQARDWGNRMNVFRVCGLLSIVLIAGIRLVAQAPGVGVARIEVADAAPGGRMPGFVFYPSTRSGGPTTLGLDRVDAALDAPKPRGGCRWWCFPTGKAERISRTTISRPSSRRME